MGKNHRRVTDPESPYSMLQQRLLFMDRFPERAWTNIIENVPRWPEMSAPPALVDWTAVHNYSPCAGESALIERITARERQHQPDVNAANVLVSNGGLHGLSLIFRSRFTPGAVALVQSPVLGAVPEMLRAFGYAVELVTVECAADVAALEARCTAGPVAVLYLNTPNNPTGAVLPAAVMQRCVALSEERGLALVVDRVYDSFVFRGARDVSPLTMSGEWSHLYTVNSMSKGFGAPGLRVGWVLSSPENVRTLAGILEREIISVSAVAQSQACALLDRGNDALVSAVVAGKARIEAELGALSGASFSVPQGGSQFFVQLPVSDVEAYCDFVLLELGLALVSSSNYEGVDGPRVRIPMGCEPATLERALPLLAQGLARYAAEPCAGSTGSAGSAAA